MTEDAFFDALRARLPRAGFTHALVACCVLAYAVSLWQTGWRWDLPVSTLRPLGGLSGIAVQQGEVWRLLSALFLHGSPLHLGLNMLALWQVGHFLEPIQGRSAFLISYFGSGLLGGLASIWWAPQTLSVGASGAIFGLYGALLVWLLQNRRQMPLSLFKPLRGGILAFIGYSLFAGYALPGIDNAAHIGGLVGGVLLALGLQRPLDAPLSPPWRQPRYWAGIAAAALCASLLWVRAPQSVQVWQQHVEFRELTQALGMQDAVLSQQIQAMMQALRQRRLAPHDAARFIDEALLPAWRQQIERLASEQVAEEDRTRHRALLRYTRLREQSLHMLGEALRTGDARWLQRAETRANEAQAALLEARAELLRRP